MNEDKKKKKNHSTGMNMKGRVKVYGTLKNKSKKINKSLDMNQSRVQPSSSSVKFWR